MKSSMDPVAIASELGVTVFSNECSSSCVDWYLFKPGQMGRAADIFINGNDNQIKQRISIAEALGKFLYNLNKTEINIKKLKDNSANKFSSDKDEEDWVASFVKHVIES